MAEAENQRAVFVDEEGNQKPLDVDLGTLYDVNKDLTEKEKDLSNSKIRDKIRQMSTTLDEGEYYMLLCRERNDYTVFEYKGDIQEFKEAMWDCITSRGGCKGIDKQMDGAFEIWISANNESFAYYFFNCTQCIIPC